MGDDAKLQSASAFVIHVFRRGAFPTQWLRTRVTVTGTAGSSELLYCASQQETDPVLAHAHQS